MGEVTGKRFRSSGGSEPRGVVNGEGCKKNPFSTSDKNDDGDGEPEPGTKSESEERGVTGLGTGEESNHGWWW